MQPTQPVQTIDEQYVNVINQFRELLDYEELSIVNDEEQIKYETQFHHLNPTNQVAQAQVAEDELQINHYHKYHN
jgi:hypothetical protein